MKGKQALVAGAAVVVIACGAAGFGYVVWNTQSNTGERAIARMNSEEREALKRIALVRSTMTAERVVQALGEPTSDIVMLAKWDGFGGSQLSQLRVYFSDGHPRKIRWLKLGYFLYEKDL